MKTADFFQRIPKKEKRKSKKEKILYFLFSVGTFQLLLIKKKG
jgi:hypothetical protein